jgi:hypothetical protein
MNTYLPKTSKIPVSKYHRGQIQIVIAMLASL